LASVGALITERVVVREMGGCADDTGWYLYS
jgi:hypothetical protein